MIERTLHRLRKDLEAVQSAARGVRGPSRASLAEALSGLHRSLEGLSEDSAKQGASPDTADAAPAQSSRRLRRLRMRSLAERSTTLVRMMGPKANCRWVNRAWLAYTGRSREQTTGTGWLQDVHPEDRQRCIDACPGRDDMHGFESLEYRLRRAQGSYGWVLELRTPRLDAEGRVGGYQGAATDVSRRHEDAACLALQRDLALVLSSTGSGRRAVVPILRLVCEHLGWDEAELWTVGAAASCMERWSRSVPAPALAKQESTTLDDEAALEVEHTSLSLPVELHGTSWGSLRLARSTPLQGHRGADAALRAVATQLAQCLEHQSLSDRLGDPMRRGVDLLDAAADAMVAIDRAGRVLEFNRAAQRRFNCSRARAVGMHIADLGLPPRLRQEVRAELARYQADHADGPVDQRLAVLDQPAVESEKDARQGVLDLGTEPLSIYVCEADSQHPPGAADLAYQTRLKSMMSELLLVEDKERRQLAADLHDGLAQTLALAKFKLVSIGRSSAAEQNALLAEVAELIEQANGSVRSISFELSPPVLHDLGLEPAVQWLVEHIQTRYGIQIELQQGGRPRATDERTRILLYRSIRELLINSAKHSGVQSVRVRLDFEEHQVCAEVSDDGVGMPPDPLRTSGYGLLSMSERLQHLGGTMHIDSAPGRGTRVRLCAPLLDEGNESSGDDV